MFACFLKGGFFKKKNESKPRQIINENVVKPIQTKPQQRGLSHLLVPACVRAGKSVLTVPGSIPTLVPGAPLLIVHEQH